MKIKLKKYLIKKVNNNMATFKEIKNEASGNVDCEFDLFFPFFILDENSTFNKPSGISPNIYRAYAYINLNKDKKMLPIGVEDEDLSMAIIKLMRFGHEKTVELLNAEIEDLKKQIKYYIDKESK